MPAQPSLVLSPLPAPARLPAPPYQVVVVNHHHHHHTHTDTHTHTPPPHPPFATPQPLHLSQQQWPTWQHAPPPAGREARGQGQARNTDSSSMRVGSVQVAGSGLPHFAASQLGRSSEATRPGGASSALLPAQPAHRLLLHLLELLLRNLLAGEARRRRLCPKRLHLRGGGLRGGACGRRQGAGAPKSAAAGAGRLHACRVQRVHCYKRCPRLPIFHSCCSPVLGLVGLRTTRGRGGARGLN